MIRKGDLSAVKKQQSLNIAKQIKTGNYTALEATLNMVCRTIPQIDEFLTDEFIAAVVQNRANEFGNDLLVATERGYPVDYKAHESKTETVKTACGKDLEIKTVQCNMPYSSQLFKQYYDKFEINKKKTLPVTITQDELRNVSCGENTYNELRNLILSKITESVEAYIRDEIYCLINDPKNYKQIVNIKYICNDSCDGIDFIQALTKFALSSQIKTPEFNIAGRLYDLRLKTGAWLLNSTDLASRLASRYARGGTNASYIDISSKFERVFDIPQLTISDGVIVGKNWLKVHRVYDELTWKYDPMARAECGVYNLDLKIKATVFNVAIPFNLVEITKGESDGATILKNKIDDLETEFTITDEADAKKQVETAIKALNTSEKPKFDLEFEFSNFIAPDVKKGSIDVKTIIKNEIGTEIDTSTKTFILKKSE